MRDQTFIRRCFGPCDATGRRGAVRYELVIELYIVFFYLGLNGKK